MHRITESRAGADILIAGAPLSTLCHLTNVLNQRGYNVRPVANCSRLHTAVGLAVPDLILLDVHLPPAGGHAVCAQLAADPDTRHVPIICTGVAADPAARAQLLAAGAADLLIEPFSPAEALACVETQLRLRSLQGQVARQASRVEYMRTERRRAEAEQRRLIADLEAYAHMVAHDLRGPLSRLTGFAELLSVAAGGRSPGNLVQYVDAIRRSAQKSINIVDELLLLATVRKLEEIDVTVLDMDVVVDESCDRLVWFIQETGADVLRPNSWPAAHGYAPWVEQMWVNYISNAVRYGGDPPRLRLGSTVLADGMVRFWVRDNGDGLDEAEKQRLFRAALPSEPVRAQGHGLGLSIVRRIAHKLGGSVGVDSAPGQGSTFWFTLPSA